VILVEKGGRGEVSHAFQGEVRLVRRLDRVDIPERRVVPEHLHVHESDEILLELRALELGTREDRPQHDDLPTHDGIFV
jgi:hypothetical protein